MSMSLTERNSEGFEFTQNNNSMEPSEFSFSTEKSEPQNVENSFSEKAKESNIHITLPNLTLAKSFETSPQNTEEDLPNGHGVIEGEGIPIPSKTLGELLNETEELPDTQILPDEERPENGKNTEVLDPEKSNAVEKTIQCSERAESGTKNTSVEVDEQDGVKSEAEPFHSTPKLNTMVNKDLSDTKVEASDASFDSFTQNFSLRFPDSQLFVPDQSTKESPPEDEKMEEESTTMKHEPVTNEKEEINDDNVCLEPESSQMLIEGQHECCNCVEEYKKKLEKIKEHTKLVYENISSYIKSRSKSKANLSKCVALLQEIDQSIGGTSVVIDLASSPSPAEDEEPKKFEKTPSGKKENKKTSRTPQKPKGEKSPVTSKDEEHDEEPFEKKDGVAVFAKWPNSGWYYPGIVEGVQGSQLKDASNVTVCFYDGLRRGMKNINVLPAHVVPIGSMVCSLEDETEMTVINYVKESENSVNFTLNTVGVEDEIKMNFNKLAIKASQMKTIKQQLDELNVEVISKNAHLVSLDNLVCGRRSRGKSLTKEAVESPRARSRDKTSSAENEPVEQPEEANKETDKETEERQTPGLNNKRKRASVSKETPSKRRASSRNLSKN